MGASVGRRRRTRVLVITSEIELVRLIRSALETEGCLVEATAKADGPFDIVLVDLPELDLDQLRQAKCAHSDAHVIAICGGYREADCIAVLDLDADYLARPFRQRDLATRVRVTELRALQRYRASTLLSMQIVADRPVRPQSRPWERADRACPNSPAHPHASGAQGEPCSDLRPHPRRARASQLGRRAARPAVVHLSLAAQDRARPATPQSSSDRTRSRLSACGRERKREPIAPTQQAVS